MRKIIKLTTPVATVMHLSQVSEDKWLGVKHQEPRALQAPRGARSRACGRGQKENQIQPAASRGVKG
jgi:hypothetical protein